MIPENAPRLDGWLTPTETAQRLGISRQAVSKMIIKGDFESLHILGPDSRPQYVVRQVEVDDLVARRTNRPTPGP